MPSTDQHDPGSQGRPSTSYEGHGDRGQDDLAAQLVDLSRSLQDEDDLQATLDGIVHAAASTVPGAGHASISAVRGRRKVVTVAATDELPRAVDHAQYETRQGPCLDTLYSQRTVRLSDLPDDRWPEFTVRAAELGVGSMLSLQLYVAEEDLGALNLFSTEAEAFTDDSEHVGLLFAAHAGIALAGAQQVAQMQRSLDTRDLIGQAKGICMERFKLTGDQAFGLLVRASQARNRKLVEVAEDLVRSGELPSR